MASVTSPRIQVLKGYETRLPYSGWIKQLSREEHEFCVRFIRRNEHLGKHEFAAKVHRLFLDKPKPRNWTLIDQVLANCNSGAFPGEE